MMHTEQTDDAQQKQKREAQASRLLIFRKSALDKILPVTAFFCLSFLALHFLYFGKLLLPLPH